MDAITRITADSFSAINQLRETEGTSVSPELVHQRFCSFLNELVQKGRDEEVPERDVQEILYALVALADEIALSKADPLRTFWTSRMLQLQYFQDNLAGENFYQRLQALRGDRRRSGVLRVYYACLLLGFQGKYAMRGGEGELMRIVDGVRKEVEDAVDLPEALSPAGAPPDEPLVRKGDRNPFLWASLGVLALAIMVFIGLRISLDSRVDDVTERVEELTR